MDMDGLDIPDAKRVGRVIAVSASQVVVLIERRNPAAPDRRSPLQMGSLVKMQTGVSTVFGMVSALRTPLPSPDPGEDDVKTVELDLVGEVLPAAAGGDAGFQRGVSVYPVLDDPVYLASSADLAQVYARPNVATARIGTIHQDSRIPAYVLTNELLGKHFGVVGTTGTGKSCIVASIFGAVIADNPNAHAMLLDPHNEYAAVFGDRAALARPGDGLYLPYWLFNFEEICEIVLGPGELKSEEAKLLGEGILHAKQPNFAKAGLELRGSVDTPSPYRISDVIQFLDSAIGSLNRGPSANAGHVLKTRLQNLRNDPRYAFIFGERLRMRDELAEILSLLFRIPVDGKPITILDVSGIPSEVLNIVVSVLCRIVFDFALWNETPVPLTIICEEAHRYAPRDTASGFEPAKRALSRIAKEGRKYGVSLCVVTQRPSDLAPGLLSECNTIFALRMTSQEDQEIICGALPEASHALMSFLPALRDGEAIAVGEGVSMPMRVRVARLPENRRPKSATASFTTAWTKECDMPVVERTIERWRQGGHPIAA
jgi:uncharacterized protein